MYENLKMENMTWQEFANKINDVIILPIGATEQHGPHLPTCVDAVLAREFAYRIAEKINGVVAPTISYGSWILVTHDDNSMFKLPKTLKKLTFNRFFFSLTSSCVIIYT